MANKKYVIMWNTKSVGNDICPTVPADDNRQIKSFQNGGYKIVGRVSCNEGFRPNAIELNEATKQPRKSIEVPPLRVCPFCGGKATIDVQYSDGLYYAQARCESCHAISNVRENKGRINAVRAAALRWNKYIVKDGVSYKNRVD